MLTSIAVSYGSYIINIHIAIKKTPKNESGMDHKTDENAKIDIPGKVLTVSTDGRIEEPCHLHVNQPLEENELTEEFRLEHERGILIGHTLQ